MESAGPQPVNSQLLEDFQFTLCLWSSLCIVPPSINKSLFNRFVEAQFIKVIMLVSQELCILQVPAGVVCTVIVPHTLAADSSTSLP